MTRQASTDRTSYAASYRAAHREKHRDYMRRYYAKNAERLRAYARSRHDPDKAWAESLRRYDLTVGQFMAMLDAQGHACAICRRAFKACPCVDHDHASGLVRGLLCHGCNRAIGFFEDAPDRMRVAATYLEAAASRFAEIEPQPDLGLELRA
jgi:hypothetical protein